MKIKLNGEPFEFSGTTALDLLNERGLNPAVVIFTRNHEMVLQDQLVCTTLQPDDDILILAFVGGG